MSLGRRKVGIDDPSRWVFNRMADVYDARPPYPPALLDALVELAAPVGGRLGDLGAGIGHLSLPLAERGLDVWAFEPAVTMLERLRDRARDRDIPLRAFHAAAEALPLDPHSLDAVVVADALHFMDAELTAREIARVLRPGGAFALIACTFADTPFMRDLLRVIEGAVPRRPRPLTQSIVHLSALADVPFTDERHFHDETAIDHEGLDRILRSISFIGPAMNPSRLAAFRDRVFALTPRPVWARKFVLRSGHRVSRPIARRSPLSG